MQIVNVRAQLDGEGTEGMENELVGEDGGWYENHGNGDGADATTDFIVGRIVSAVAARTERAPMELTPLHSVVDADALATLLDRTPSTTDGVRVTFTFEGLRVTVGGDGRVRLREAES